MSFNYTVDQNEAAKADEVSRGGMFLDSSGVYGDITIKQARYYRNPANASSSINFDLVVKTEEGEMTAWPSIQLTNKDGSSNYAKAIFDAMLVILKIPSITTVPGRNDKGDPIEVIQELAGKKLFASIQIERYNKDGKPTSRYHIRHVFIPTWNITYSEYVAGIKPGEGRKILEPCNDFIGKDYNTARSATAAFPGAPAFGTPVGQGFGMPPQQSFGAAPQQPQPQMQQPSNGFGFATQQQSPMMGDTDLPFSTGGQAPMSFSDMINGRG